MEEQKLSQETLLEAIKASPAVAGTAYSMATLNHWVALATLVYILIQTFILLEKRHYRIKDRKKAEQNEHPK